MRTPENVRSSDPNADLTIAGVLATLRQRKGVILSTTVVLAALVAAYCLIAIPRYRATSLVEVQASSNDLLNLGSLMSTQPGEMGDAMNASLDLQTQVEILQSDGLALKIIKDLDLEHSRDFKPHWSPIGAVLGLFAAKGPPDPVAASLENSPKRRSAAIRKFTSQLKVKPVAGTRLISISFTSSDPKIAAAVVNDLDQSLVDFGLNQRNEETNQTSKWLGHQLADLKQQAQDLQGKVVALQRETGIYNLGEDTTTGKDQLYSSTLDQLQQATTTLSAATSSRIMKGALYDTVRNGDPELISGLAGSSMGQASSSVQGSLSLLQTLRAQQATASAQLAQDTSKFGSSYPQLVDERSSLQTLNRMVSDEIARIGDRAKNDYDAAKATESQLQAIYDRRKVQAEKLNDRAIEYGIAKQEADNSRQLFEDLTKRLGEAGIIEGLHSSNISVVSAARVPADPASPNFPIYELAAIMVGLFLGTCGALYADMMDTTIQSYRGIEESLGIVLFAVLPTFATSRFLSAHPRWLWKRLSGGTSTEDPVIVVNDPSNPFAEAMRGLRLSLLSQNEGPPPQVILVTSSVPREGKTTIASNLAVLLGQSGKSVLFIEGDMRHPDPPSYFPSTKNSVLGLSELLADPALVMENNPVANAGGLQLLPAGPRARHPSDLLSTGRTRDLMERWKRDFDHVVIDSPPILEFTDSLVLAQLADITLLVARVGVTPERSLERTWRMLEYSTTAKIGVVINAADRASVSYADYFGYHGSDNYKVS